MKIACLNIAKGIHSKAATIEEILNKKRIDILCFLETDFPNNINAPSFNGYHEPISHINPSNYTRIFCYVKRKFEFTKLEKESVTNHANAPPYRKIALCIKFFADIGGGGQNPILSPLTRHWGRGHLHTHPRQNFAPAPLKIFQIRPLLYST